jgi:PAS domain S-box-containing protein
MLAFGVMLLAAAAFLAAAPFARVRLPELWAFIPIYQSALALNELITAVLLLAQFRIVRSRALLALACGYLFVAGMVTAHTLSFPGLFAPTGLLGAGPQTTAWLYMYWHGGFPLFVIAYAWLKEGAAGAPPKPQSTVSTLVLAFGGVAAAVVGLTLLATAGHGLLPPIMRGSAYTASMFVVVSTVWLLNVGALLAVWLRRPHGALDLWLMVAMCAWVFDIALSAVLNAGRFDLGFYVGRIYGLLAATFVLMVLLFQTGVLYARLARLLDTEQHERRSESEQRRRIFETSLDLILITDRQGAFLQVSPSSKAILGYEPAEMIGRSAIDFVFFDDLAPIRQEMRLARREGHSIRNFETRYLHRNGRVVTLVWSGVWSAPEQQYFFIGRDMTEQKRNEQLKDEFVATVSHELRTPMASIAASLALLESGAIGQVSDSVRRMVKIALGNSRRLSRLINDILDVEKLQAGKMAFDMRPLDAKALVEEAIEANAAFADSFNVRIRLDQASTKEFVRVDRDRLIQVLINLLSNAAKFSPSGGEVVVAVRAEAGHVRIAVRDHGSGIPDEFKGRIFEKFAQADGTDTRRPGGSGLGLSIAKQIVVRLGGTIGFETAPGGGTVFFVDLPRAGAVIFSEELEPEEPSRLARRA